MKQGSSNRKVNQQAREVIASILLFEISDPRLNLVTVTGCEVSYDRSVCNVYYTCEPDRYEQTKEAFAAARGRIRSLMAKELSWRVAPELRFCLDRSVDQAEVIAVALERDRERNETSAGTFDAIESVADDAGSADDANGLDAATGADTAANASEDPR